MCYLSSEVPQRLIKDGCSMRFELLLYSYSKQRNEKKQTNKKNKNNWADFLMAESHTPIVNACLQAF